MHLAQSLIFPVLLVSVVIGIPQLRRRQDEDDPFEDVNYSFDFSDLDNTPTSTSPAPKPSPAPKTSKDIKDMKGDVDLVKTCTESYLTEKGGKCVTWKASDAKAGKDGCVNVKIVDDEGKAKEKDMNDQISSIQTFQHSCEFFK
jgi:hypothetical protein